MNRRTALQPWEMDHRALLFCRAVISLAVLGLVVALVVGGLS